VGGGAPRGRTLGRGLRGLDPADFRLERGALRARGRERVLLCAARLLKGALLGVQQHVHARQRADALGGLAGDLAIGVLERREVGGGRVGLRLRPLGDRDDRLLGVLQVGDLVQEIGEPVRLEHDRDEVRL
jgi:hypothetical protein